VLVNPYDVEQMADTILKAFRMSQAERIPRMKRMRRVVRNENVFWWVDSFLKAGAKMAARSSQPSRRRQAKFAR
jgi:trehalose 6-phosphate synthase/phosphatase